MKYIIVPPKPGLRALDEFTKGLAGGGMPIGHVSVYADGSKWRKTGPGTWVPANEKAQRAAAEGTGQRQPHGAPAGKPRAPGTGGTKTPTDTRYTITTGAMRADSTGAHGRPRDARSPMPAPKAAPTKQEQAQARATELAEKIHRARQIGNTMEERVKSANAAKEELRQKHGLPDPKTAGTHVTLEESAAVAADLGGSEVMHITSGNTKLAVAVPKDPGRIHKAWMAERDRINARIGDAPKTIDWSVAKNGKPPWTNDHVNTPEEVHQQALSVEKTWVADIGAIAAAAGDGAEANFGPGSEHAVKKIKKIKEKVANIMQEQGVSEMVASRMTINDVIRGTVLVDRPEQIGPVLSAALKKYGQANMFIDNKYEYDRGGGYCGVHLGIKLPTPDGSSMWAELQIHIRPFNNGTDDSPKEQGHKLYKDVPEGELPQAKAASYLLFTAALRRIK